MSPSESFRLFYSLCTWRNMSAEKQILALRGSMSMYVMLTVLHHVDFWNEVISCQDCFFGFFVVLLFPFTFTGTKNNTTVIHKIFEGWYVRHGKVGGTAKWAKGRDVLPFLCCFFSDPWPHRILAVMCASVSAAVYLSCGVLMLMSHSCLLRPDWVHYTHRCTSHTSPTGNVCFLLWFSLCFPLKAQSAMFYSLFCCQNEMLSPHFSESSSTSERKLSPRLLNHWLELRLVSSEYSLYSNHIMCQWMGYRLVEWCRGCMCGDKVA